MQSQFTASQSIELLVAERSIPIHHYLRQPQRLMQALVDPSRIELLGDDCFRLKMRSLSFLMLSIQPTVDLQVWTEANGTLHLRSIGCEIRGVEYVNERFHLNLSGQLAPVQRGTSTILTGQANLKVSVDIPPALWLTPKTLLEATGNGLLKSVLLTVKQRLSHHLLSDYYRWAAAQTQQHDESLTRNARPVLE